MKLHLKMRSKILLLCLGSTFFALILQTYFFQDISSNLIYNLTKQESYNALQNMQNDIYSFVKNIESEMLEVYNEKDFIQELKKDPTVDSLKSSYNRLAFNLGTKNFETTDGVVALYLYNSSDQIISTYRRATTPKHNYTTDIYTDIAYQNSEIVKNYVHSKDIIMLISSYYNTYRETNIVRFVLKIYNNSNHENIIGYVVCDVDSKVLRKIMDKYSADKSMLIWLQPMGDRPIMSMGNIEDEDRKFFEEIASNIQSGSRNASTNLTESERVFFNVDQEKYNISAYSLMPQSLLEQNQIILTRNLLIIALIMIIATLLLTIPVTSSLTKPLHKMMQVMQRIKNGDTRLRITLKNRDEIGALAQNFNEMLDRIEVLIGHEYENKLMLNRAEYKALQAQINPHFLYNTLDAMSSIADVQGCGQISGLSMSLSNIFRYSLDMKNPFSTLAKEIVHLKNYVYVMDVRIRDQVKYTFDIDENVLQDTLPRISIQPLVENALTHGLRNQRGEKRINISAGIVEETLVLTVEDNGIGMDATQINEMLKENNLETVEKGNSIGLNNINARLKMLYGQSYGLQVESEMGKGTKVTLIIPRVTMQEADSWMQNSLKF